MKNQKKSKKKFFVFGALAFLVVIAIVGAVSHNKGQSSVEVTTIQATPIEQIQSEQPEQEIPITSEQRLDFKVTSDGKGNLSTFNIIIWTTDGKQYNLGEFSFALRVIETYAQHGERYVDNLIDYYIPDDWNSSQKLSEAVTVEETTREPVRAPVGNEPLFLRGQDYPQNIPFDEIEIQVDLVNYYTDVDETEYIAWLRIKENEKLFDIKKIMIEGYGDELPENLS